MERRWLLLFLCAVFIGIAAAQSSTAPSPTDSVAQNATVDSANGTADISFANDPILQYKPSFACSLPVQILMTGIVLTLTSVLLIHLIFTAQYHWPLAPVNYALQVSAVFTLLVSLVATLQVILTTTSKESRAWPYMFTYIAVDIPPLEDNSGWTGGELAAWLLMNATTSALIQITHIQFLTLLFPSGLERRLIFCLLGPLAVTAAVMQLLPIHDTPNGKLTSIATAIQNVCNATLSLLFTASLFLWGLLINRKQAWRTDGGTAAFGAGALTLALASTAITFVYIPHKDQYAWMPGLMWAVILWQSFLGWWWWVGAGMGVGEVEDLLRREEKRRRKRKMKLAKRKERKEKADMFWKGVAGAFGYGQQKHGRVEQSGNTSDEGHRSGDEEPNAEGRFTRPRNRRPSNESTAPSTISTTAPSLFSRIVNHRAGRFFYGWFLLLRHAHLTAAREQAVEHGERIQQVYGREAGHGEGSQDVPVEPGAVGWGLGSYGIRQIEAEAERRDGNDHLLSGDEEIDGDGDGDGDDGDVEQKQGSPNGGSKDGPGARRRKSLKGGREKDLEGGTEKVESQSPREAAQPSSMWWWGPLRRWRLQDSTVYS